MAEVRVPNLRVGYKTVIDTILNEGDKVAPRGQPTREVLGFILRVEDPTNNVLTGVRKGYNPAIGAAEAAQLISGTSDPKLMVSISKNFASFLDAGIFHGAYGPRIKTQLPRIAEILDRDRSTRQAIVQIWRPQDDLWGNTRDLPCTLGFQFFIRNDKLVMQTRMRSNDVNWGLPYDVFQFTQLQLTVANIMGIEAGEYIHTVGSMHIYEKDVDGLLDVESHEDDADGPLGFGSELSGLMPKLEIYTAMNQAKDVVEGYDENIRDAEQAWYFETLRKYRA